MFLRVRSHRWPALCLRLAVVPLGATLTPTSAAAVCGTFSADDGDNRIYVGIAARPLQLICPFGPLDGWAVVPDGAARAAICWQDRDGDWRYEEVATCNGGSDPSDALMILAGEGDDTVVPITHQGVNEEFVCPVPGSSGALYGYVTPEGIPVPPSPPLLEWQERHVDDSLRSNSDCRNEAGCSVLPMGLSVLGGPGSDVVHGTPLDDFIYTAEFDAPIDCEDHRAKGSTDADLNACVCPVDSYCCQTAWDELCVSEAQDLCGLDCAGPFEYLAGDDEIDTACGHDGSDFMVGDRDDRSGAHERFAGGPGASDYCNGTNDVLACCTAAAGPGCDDAAIEAAVCAVDPYCCETRWDAVCVDEVTDVAGSSCDNPSAADNATSSCETVVDAAQYDWVWTGACVPGWPGGPPMGSCFEPSAAAVICGDDDPESLPPAGYPTVSSRIYSDTMDAYQEECRLFGGLPGR